MNEIVHKSFKYRLYPNRETQEKLIWILTRCRELYNAALDERRSAVKRVYPMKQIGHVLVMQHKDIEYKAKNGEKKQVRAFPVSQALVGRKVSRFDQSRQLTEIKHEIRPEYQDINDHILRNVLERVDLAFKAFFRRCKAGENPGYPRFQGAN